ncbi:type I 3-dehydroquinate dehydratase [Streptomyces aidingensis]|uniref:type I 3-dehydroquinate dehydratase n=1 Tax=Streptomyces aidingensis TaxID=910347 RepID=UPI001587802B|nr:type I 3-dehydroquinate dehydratase [Streptomyces aidingensis]
MRDRLGSETPLIAVSFRDSDNERLSKEAMGAGVDVAELRIDKFSRADTGHVLAQVKLFRELATLATIRSREEGGHWDGAEEERLELFRTVAPVVDAVDIELSSRGILPEVIATARENDTVAVVSYHNFEATPGRQELEAVVRDAARAGADVVKISTMVASGADLRRLASLLVAREDGPELIVIAMGALGAVSRVFFPALGSRLTYSFIGSSFAPGQLDFHETFHLLRQFYPDFNQRKINELSLFEAV